MAELRGVLGIDPGLDGAIALLALDGSLARVWDAPVTTVKKSTKGTKRVYLEAECAALLRAARIAVGGNVLVGLERLTAMPALAGTGDARSMGAASAFNMGMGWGLWRGLCVGVGLPYLLVSPVSWKRHFTVAGKQAGGDSRVVAQQRFPQCAGDLGRKKDEGRADALLIALYVMESGRHGQQKGTQDE